MDANTLQDRLRALPLEGASVDGLLRFREDLLRFNQGRNLVSREGGAALVDRLILECAAAARVLPYEEGHRILDLGTGGGFPGIPFALARPRPTPMTLLDRRPVACDFLRREISELSIPEVEVWEGQSKEILSSEQGARGGFDWVLLKAVAPPPDALELARPFLSAGGRAAIFRDLDYKPEALALQPKAHRPPHWEWRGGIALDPVSGCSERAALQVFERLS